MSIKNTISAHRATSNEHIAENIRDLSTLAFSFPRLVPRVEVDNHFAIEECLHSYFDLD
ncbi:MAG: hypothetical protein ABR905_06125 [Terracidiphilus sp.]